MEKKYFVTMMGVETSSGVHFWLLRVCAHSHWQIEALRLLPWKSGPTIQEAGAYLKGIGRRTQRTSQELCRTYQKMYSHVSLCSIINLKRGKLSLCSKGRNVGNWKRGSSVGSWGCLEFTRTDIYWYVCLVFLVMTCKPECSWMKCQKFSVLSMAVFYSFGVEIYYYYYYSIRLWGKYDITLI